MSEQIQLSTVVNNALRSITSQLESAMELATGPARNVIANLLNEQGLLAIHFGAIMDGVNTDANEYNDVLGELEARYADAEKAELALASIKSQLASAELAQAEAEALSAEQQAAIKLMEARLTQQDQAHKEANKKFGDVLRDLKKAEGQAGEIERLKMLGNKKQTELEELRAASITQRTELAKHRKEKARIASDLADAGAKNNFLQERVDDLSNRLTFNDGDVTNQTFEGDNGAGFYLYTFGFGIKCQEADRVLITPNWHMEIRSTTGHCVLVMVDENLSPVIPTSVDMGMPPKALIDLMKGVILDRCKDAFPDLHARRQWSEATSMADTGATPALLKKLAAAGIDTVFDVLTYPARKMVLLPGIGEVTASAAHNLANAAVSAWQKEYEAEQRKNKKAA